MNGSNQSNLSAGNLTSDLRARLEDIYRRLGEDIATTGVACNQRGVCCDFERFEHTLFATTIEMRNLIESRGLDPARFSGKLCPYWDTGKCTAREARPLGCRVYFCDQSYIDKHSQSLYQRYHGEIEALARECGDDYAYVPMVAGLKRFVREGRFFDPRAPFAEF